MATSDPGLKFVSYILLGQTTDATPATYTLKTMADNEVLCMERLVLVGRVTGTTEYYVRAATTGIWTCAASIVTEQTKTLGSENRLTLAATVTADLSISGSNLQVSCTGEATKTIDWYAAVEYTII